MLTGRYFGHGGAVIPAASFGQFSRFADAVEAGRRSARGRTIAAPVPRRRFAASRTTPVRPRTPLAVDRALGGARVTRARFVEEGRT